MPFSSLVLWRYTSIMVSAVCYNYNSGYHQHYWAANDIKMFSYVKESCEPNFEQVAHQHVISEHISSMTSTRWCTVRISTMNVDTDLWSC